MPELLAALDAFVQEHQRCGDLDSGLDHGVVWLACSCGAQIAHPASAPPLAPARTERARGGSLGALPPTPSLGAWGDPSESLADLPRPTTGP
jgi:hypothetical protein